jgi:hypothetical protein
MLKKLIKVMRTGFFRLSAAIAVKFPLQENTTLDSTQVGELLGKYYLLDKISFHGSICLETYETPILLIYVFLYFQVFVALHKQSSKEVSI